MKYIFYDSSGAFKDPIKKECLSMLREVFGGDFIIPCSLTNDAIKNYEEARKIKNSKGVFIWNGSEVGCFWVKELCKAYKIPYCIIERGLFPQSNTTFMVDSEGICCRSKNLDPKHTLKLKSSKELLIKHKKETPPKKTIKKGKIAVVLQLEFDSTIYHYSPFETNDIFIQWTKKWSEIFGYDDFVVCPHPRNKNIKCDFKVSEKRTVDECSDAELCVGISSTTLYELKFLGCPVKVLGGLPNSEHPINRPFKSTDQLITCVLDYQIDTSIHSSKQIKEKIRKVLS